MKLKGIIIIAMSLFLITGALSLNAAPPPPSTNGVVVATINSTTGDVTICENILKKQFKDGGMISTFQVKVFQDGWNLLRIGVNASGLSQTEAIQVARIGNEIKFFPVTWYVVCDMAGCSFCSPNSQKSACECPSGSNCNFGIDHSGLGYVDVVII
jgi:hypothetical protein